MWVNDGFAVLKLIAYVMWKAVGTMYTRSTVFIKALITHHCVRPSVIVFTNAMNTERLCVWVCVRDNVIMFMLIYSLATPEADKWPYKAKITH